MLQRVGTWRLVERQRRYVFTCMSVRRVVLCHPTHLVELCHERGINVRCVAAALPALLCQNHAPSSVRHLGDLRVHVSTSNLHAKHRPAQDRSGTLVLTEMVTRAIKWLVNRNFRSAALGEWMPSGTDNCAQWSSQLAQLRPMFPAFQTATLQRILDMYDGDAMRAAARLVDLQPDGIPPDAPLEIRVVVDSINDVVGAQQSLFWDVAVPWCVRVKFGARLPALSSSKPHGVSRRELRGVPCRSLLAGPFLMGCVHQSG